MKNLKNVAIIFIIALGVTSCNNDRDFLSSEYSDDPIIEVLDLVKNFERT